MTVHPYSRIFTGKTAAPTINDDTSLSYEVGDMWIDETNDKTYQAVDVTDGVAIWLLITPSVATSLYLDTTASLADNFTLSISPSVYAETANAKSVNGALEFFERFVSPPLGVTSIPAGTWEFNIYGSTSSDVGSNLIKFRVNKRVAQTGMTGTFTGAGPTRTFTVTGGTPFVAGDANASRLLAGLVETPNQTGWISAFTSSSVVTVTLTDPAYVNETGVELSAIYYYLFDSTTSELSGSSAALYTVFSTQAAFSCSETDRLVIALFGLNDTATHTLTLYYGGTANFTHFHTTFPIASNPLAGTGGGITDAPSDTTFYGRMDAAWVNPTTDDINRVGTDVIVNGTFDADTDWDKGTGWTITGGQLVGTATADATFASVPPLIAGLPYLITFDVVVTSGGIQFSAGDSQLGTLRSASGTYAEEVTPDVSGNFGFGPDVSFTGTIDNVTAISVEVLTDILADLESLIPISITNIDDSDNVYSVLLSDDTIIADATNAEVDMELPSSTGSGRIYHVKKIDSAANDVVVLATQDSGLIDGATQYVLSVQYEAVTVQDGGTDIWHILSHYTP